MKQAAHMLSPPGLEVRSTPSLAVLIALLLLFTALRALPADATEIEGHWATTAEACPRGEYDLEVQQSQLSWGSGDWSCQLSEGFRHPTQWVLRGKCCVADYKCDHPGSVIKLELSGGILRFQVLGLIEPSYYAFKCGQ